MGNCSSKVWSGNNKNGALSYAMCNVGIDHDPIPEQVNLNTKARGNSNNDVKAITIYFYCFEFSLNLIDAVAFDKPKIYFRQADHFSIPGCSGWMKCNPFK